MHQKLVPDPFLILLYHLKQPLHTRSSFKNKKFWKRIIKKKVNFIFRTQSLLIYKIIKNKRVLEPVNIHSSGYEKSSEKFLCYVLSDQVWWCNVKQFLSYSKNYICEFMQVNSWHHKLYRFHLSFWTWKVWKGKGKITKIWIYREWKELFRWN